MTKTELVAKLAEMLDISKKLASQMVSSFTEAVISEVESGGEVRLQGFGTFKSSKRAARTGVNPRNPDEKITIPAMNVVNFRAGSEFKSRVR